MTETCPVYNSPRIWPLTLFLKAEDGIRDLTVTGVQTCALPISLVEHGEHTLRQPPREGHTRFAQPFQAGLVLARGQRDVQVALDRADGQVAPGAGLGGQRRLSPAPEPAALHPPRRPDVAAPLARIELVFADLQGALDQQQLPQQRLVDTDHGVCLLGCLSGWHPGVTQTRRTGRDRHLRSPPTCRPPRRLGTARNGAPPVCRGTAAPN